MPLFCRECGNNPFQALLCALGMSIITLIIEGILFIINMEKIERMMNKRTESKVSDCY